MKHRRWLFKLAIVLGLLLVVSSVLSLTWRTGEVTGTVTADGKPLADAIVRVKATKFEARTDRDGRYVLENFPPRFNIHVTAWVDGYYIGGAIALPWQPVVDISLQPYRSADNPAYHWLQPKIDGRSPVEEILVRAGLPVAARLSFKHLFLPLAAKLNLGCSDCHGATIYREYASGAHAQGTKNILFRTTYNGTDTRGNQSPPTRYGVSRDYGRFPLGPDPNQPYYGPGLKLDFPDQAGNCATCHMPGEALAAPHNTDINKIPRTAVQGTHCDFCHKVVDVRLNPVTGVPDENMTGILSMELRRPDGEPQAFFGPFDDVDAGPDIYSPLQDESRYCAACHNASFWGTPIYQSYDEWLKSPYPAEGKTCQTCHMKPDGTTSNFAPGRGGLERDPQKLFSHIFPGAADVELLQNTAKMELSATRQTGRILVEAKVFNENGGHHIPTDHPMRNIILVVKATDASGKVLEEMGGQKIPEWGGKGIGPGDYAGLPGKGYAKVLEELWTEVSPTIAYWQQTKIKEDTRIPARATDVTHYDFKAPEKGAVTIEARLIFRRAFKELAEVKKWDIQDIQMEGETITVP